MLLKDKLKDFNLILASASPRRRQILADSGLPFTLAPPYEANEVWPHDLPVEVVAEYLALLKSNACPAPLGPKDILLTADTTVVLDGRVLGKPHDTREAAEMLEKLSGRAHKVFTGVALRSPKTILRDVGGGGGTSHSATGRNTTNPNASATNDTDEINTLDRRHTFSVETIVNFRRLTVEEIAHYVDTFRPLDKAGAYGIQEWIGYIGIERIEGSFHNVMGMPMQTIYAELEKYIFTR